MRYTSPLQWGMIGTGDVTERKSGPAFSKIEGSRLVAVGNRTPEKAEDYARRHGIRRVHRDPADVIHDPEVHAVYVATPPDSHVLYALECIRTGKPVYLEKPMALNHAGCEEINRAAEYSGVPVYVAYYRRGLEYFHIVKKILEEKRLGPVLHIDMLQYFPPRPEDFDRENPPWRLVPEISGGGYFHDVGCHALDILFFLFGDPVQVTGNSTNLEGLYEADDTVSALLTLPGEIPVTAGWSFVVPESLAADRVTVTGKEGRLEFSIFSFDPIRLTPAAGDPETFSAGQPEHIQMPFIRTMVEELMETNNACPSTGTTAAVTSRVMDEITCS